MIEGFIYGRKFTYQAKGHLDAEMDKLVEKCKALAAAAAVAADENASANVSSSQLTPPMLPSPASIVASNSANSTPIGQANGTPNTASSSSVTASSSAASAAAAAAAHLQQQQLQPLPPNMVPTMPNGLPLTPAAAAAAASVTISITPTMTQQLKDSSGAIVAGSFCMSFVQQTLSLPILARHFPTTFARMVHSSLLPHEEHEPDIEDEEGELFWPGQCVTGEGLGWVCLMGKAMIKEFGKDIGYRGLDGVVPKPKVEEGPETPSSVGQGPSPGQAQNLGSSGGHASQAVAGSASSAGAER
jgi:hypothetical protein